jgi:hypothetical protein
MTDNQLEELWQRLPLPSECEAERICIPIVTDETLNHWVPFEAPPFGEVYFRKKYINSICVGWELET